MNRLDALLPPARRPIFSIRVDGADITAKLSNRLISLTLTDNRGFEADQIDLMLDDGDGQLDLPPRGAEIRVSLGWADSGLVDKGVYTVDDIEHSGAPDVLTIRARSADLRAGISTQKERSFHATNVGAIVRAIADENDLKPLVSPALAVQVIDHLDQTDESSANLLTRLARQFDAIATVKNGHLLFIHAGGGVSASGKALPSLVITRRLGDQHRFSLTDRENYTHVRATWHDLGKAEKGEIVWGKDAESGEKTTRVVPPQTDQPAVASGKYQDAGKISKNRDAALRLARKKWTSLKKSPALRAAYTGIKAAYDDRAMGVKGAVTYGQAEEDKARQSAARLARKDVEKLTTGEPQVAIEPSGANIKTLRHVYASKENAKRAARAEWRRLQRGMAAFGITLAEGRPDLIPDAPAAVQGFKAAIDGTGWTIDRVTHNLSDGGYTTAVDLEIRATEIPG